MCPVCVSAASMCVHMSGVCTDISSSERCTVRDTMSDHSPVLSCSVPSPSPVSDTAVFSLLSAGPLTVTMDLGPRILELLESGILGLESRSKILRTSERISEIRCKYLKYLL